MIEWTKDNHLKFGYNSWFDLSYSPDDKFKVQYGKVDPDRAESLSWKQECISAAKQIGNSASKPICLFLSGGLDGEFMAHCFLQAGVPFKVATVKYINPFDNDFETKYVDQFCARHGVEHIVFDLDLNEFLIAESIKYAQSIRVFEGFRATRLWAVEKIANMNYYPVIGQGEMLFMSGHQIMEWYSDPCFDLNRIADRSSWYFLENEAVFAWNKFFSVKKIEGCPAFFQYTPEQMYSYLTEDSTLKLINSDLKTTSNVSIKYEQYSSVFPEITESRPSQTGFENFLNLNDFLYDQYFDLSKIYGYKKKTSLILFSYSEIKDLLIRKIG